MINPNNIESAIEALLFSSSEAVPTKKLAEMLEVDIDEIESACAGLAQKYIVAESGIVLKQIAGGWRLFSAPEYHDLIEKYVLSLDTRKLSAAALETLAIVAYAQPVTRNGVAAARGVNSDSSINSLVEKGLIRESGTDSSQNNAILYSTTTTFLEHFGLNSVKDLPPLDDFAPDEKTKNFIAERLSATKIDSTQQQLDLDEQNTDELDNDAENTKGSKDSSDDSNTQNSQADAKSMFETAITSALGATDKVDFDEIRIDTDEE